MAVGAGSIKRAAKASGNAQQKEVLYEATQEKQVAEKKVEKKVEKKASKKGSNLGKKTTEVIEYKTEVNQVYHITEDLPIYLL